MKSSSALFFYTEVAGTESHVVVNTHGKGIGLLKYHAHVFAQRGEIYVCLINVRASDFHGPETLQPSTRSFMRLKVRRSVDLPQPDGPISAVTFLVGTVMSICFNACISP